MAYFYSCPKCGCNLDPGEKCDCEREAHYYERKRKKLEELLRKHTNTDEKTGQMVFVW